MGSRSRSPSTLSASLLIPNTYHTGFPPVQSALRRLDVPSGLSTDPLQFGAKFFFDHYCKNLLPFCRNFEDWLAQVYGDHAPDSLPRAAVEAVGMAGLWNRNNPTSVPLKVSKRYDEALNALHHALCHPSKVAADETLMAIGLLTLYVVR